MARSSKYKPAVAFVVLLVGVALGGMGAWMISGSLFGAVASADKRVRKAPKARASSSAAATTSVLKPGGDPVDVGEAALNAKEALRPSAAPKAAPLGAVKAPAIVGEPPKAAPAFEIMEKPFDLRCPKAIRRFDRGAKALADVDAARFCQSLRGKAHAFVFWQTGCVSCTDELALLQGRASTYAGWASPLRLTFVSTDERDVALAGFFSEKKGWYFDTLYTESMTWLGDYGSRLELPDLPWVFLVDADRQVVFEGLGPSDPSQLKAFELLLMKVAERPQTGTKGAGGAAVKKKTADDGGAASKTDAKKKASAKKSAKKKSAKKKKNVSRRSVDYVNLGLQIMRLYPDLAQSPDLRKVVKTSERVLKKKLNSMSVGAANRAVANLPDKMVRSAVSTVKKSLGL